MSLGCIMCLKIGQNLVRGRETNNVGEDRGGNGGKKPNYNDLILSIKIRFRVTYIFREGNACADKLANLGFIHRESFHWYNRLPSSLFLEFFINRYSLPMYCFC